MSTVKASAMYILSVNWIELIDRVLRQYSRKRPYKLFRLSEQIYDYYNECLHVAVGEK